MADLLSTNRPAPRDRTAIASPARRGRSKPVVRRDLTPAARDRSRWIETAYLAEIGAQLDRQARASR